ncbi:MAG: CAP domain-containing protein [Mobilitalea sp.]
MKRIIIISACTLALSLFGAFGTNINSMNAEAQTNTVKSTTQVVQNVTNKDCKEIIAKILSSKKVSKKDLAKMNSAKKKCPKKKVANATAVNNTKNSPVLQYKNVDLSKCNSTKDVVSTLQKNGYTQITNSNVQDINSLDNILAYIKKCNTTNNNTNSTGTTKPVPTQTPTTKPVPTTKPAPTTAPAPTTKPAPTTAPAPTTKPSPTTAPTPTTKPSTPTNTSGISNYANQVLQLVNQERVKAGLSALTTNAIITSAANKRAQETVQSFSHTRPNGSSFSTVLKEYGVPFNAAGENIAYGQKTPQDVVTGWMNSPGHRANILNSSFGKIGIGVYQTNGVIYWTQLFTN